MGGSSGGTVHRNDADSTSIRDKPTGLKLYVALYGIGWTVVLLLVIRSSPLLWFLIPIPIAGLYIVYGLWKLRDWAWLASIFLHVLAVFLTIGEFLIGNVDLLSFGGELVTSSVFLGYLYVIRDIFIE